MGDGPNKIPIDMSRHVAQRRALAEWRERQRVFVTHQTFGDRYSARVLVDGQYYDVSRGELESLRAGRTPADLDLYPAAGDD